MTKRCESSWGGDVLFVPESFLHRMQMR